MGADQASRQWPAESLRAITWERTARCNCSHRARSGTVRCIVHHRRNIGPPGRLHAQHDCMGKIGRIRQHPLKALTASKSGLSSCTPSRKVLMVSDPRSSINKFENQCWRWRDCHAGCIKHPRAATGRNLGLPSCTCMTRQWDSTNYPTGIGRAPSRRTSLPRHRTVSPHCPCLRLTLLTEERASF
jgi:hypothetical protein